MLNLFLSSEMDSKQQQKIVFFVNLYHPNSNKKKHFVEQLAKAFLKTIQKDSICVSWFFILFCNQVTLFYSFLSGNQC